MLPGQLEISFGAWISAVGVWHCSTAVVSRWSHGKSVSTEMKPPIVAGLVHMLFARSQLPG